MTDLWLHIIYPRNYKWSSPGEIGQLMSVIVELFAISIWLTCRSVIS